MKLPFGISSPDLRKSLTTPIDPALALAGIGLAECLPTGSAVP